MSEHIHFVVSVVSEALDIVFCFEKSSLDFFVFGADEFELVLELRKRSCRKPKVLLSIPYLLVEARVFGKQLLNPLFVSL